MEEPLRASLVTVERSHQRSKRPTLTSQRVQERKQISHVFGFQRVEPLLRLCTLPVVREDGVANGRRARVREKTFARLQAPQRSRPPLRSVRCALLAAVT